MPKKYLKEIRHVKLFFFVYPIFASLFLFLTKAEYLLSILFFFGVPSIILSLRDSHIVKKAALFSMVMTIPFTILIDYIAHLTGTWFVGQTYFPRLFGHVVVEDFLWGFLYTYFIVLYYEYFINHKFEDKLYYPKLKYLVYLLFTLLTIFFIFLIQKPLALKISFFYLKLGIFMILLPLIIVLFNFPRILAKFAKAGGYFFYLSFIYEITALKLGHWSFPGTDFIGWISVLGVRFPIEELVFWFMLGSLGILSFYEFFDDKPK